MNTNQKFVQEVIKEREQHEIALRDKEEFIDELLTELQETEEDKLKLKKKLKKTKIIAGVVVTLAVGTAALYLKKYIGAKQEAKEIEDTLDKILDINEWLWEENERLTDRVIEAIDAGY